MGPEAAAGGAIALIETGDEIVVDLNKNELNCTQLQQEQTRLERETLWKDLVAENDGLHPSVGDADTRLLNRMRNSAVSAVYGAGMHPNRSLWVRDPRKPQKSNFEPSNKFR